MSSTPIALEDIAKKLGIAVSTVSRALRDLPGIHPTTRMKILQEAQEMGYVAPRKRNQVAPPPRNILTLTIGGEIPATFLSGMSEASIVHNFSLLSHHFSHDQGRHILDPNFQPPSLRTGLVAGIILVYQWPDDVVELISRKWPTISISIPYYNPSIDLVGIDESGGMVALIRHLLDGGHSQIGFFGLHPTTRWTNARFGAYMEAMSLLDQPLDLSNVITIKDNRILVRHPIQDPQLFDTVIQKIKLGVRAWICANDAIAHALGTGLLQRGLRIPEDVSITGFHRRLFPSSPLTDLTTTSVKEELLGADALHRLAYLLDHPKDPPRTILVPCELHLGNTTSTPTK